MSLWCRSTSSTTESATNREILSPLFMKGLNLLPAQMMSKPARITLSEEQDYPLARLPFSPPPSVCQHKE
jgi:hypothetical protein